MTAPDHLERLPCLHGPFPRSAEVQGLLDGPGFVGGEHDGGGRVRILRPWAPEAGELALVVDDDREPKRGDYHYTGLMRPATEPIPIDDAPHRNRGLFSDHYLNATLPRRPEWRALAEGARPIMESVARLFESYVPSDNEAQTEQDLDLCC